MKTFLSIGSGPGIGLATAVRFAREGYRVVLSARTTDKVERLAEQLTAKNYNAEARTVDVGNPESVARLVADVESASSVDVLHFNAASMRVATLDDQPRQSFNSDLAVNIGGALVAVQAVAKEMAKRGSGSILLTGGGLALYPHPEYLSVSVGKAGLRALAHAIFEPLKQKGVHVGTVTVAGLVTTAEDAAAVAEEFWRLHDQPVGSWEVEKVYTPKG
ncbi:SDR family oxidoreductase [Rhizobium glycinendophyticum]|uniref:SDR family NAD(P)-dependent oxidoreductase n=1 Tax=Rhizobium glycinendophyticum TaxID=2589807 RepID=A0A504U3U2_9HYPH|nr:SDR family NAD(P)-dependent oxidoreductase [Rhizobium glycinendophyticum]TPP05035.1 SDR family NAD(P)-dependent oxidoreductase [Rhizobium glycinendophyticum]